jgi:hypothetical protein
MSVRLWWGAVAAALIGVACWTPVVEVRCQTDQDCGSGWRCVERQCVPPGFDAGSGGGTGAGGGTGGGGGPSCTNDLQCGKGALCCNGACQVGSCCSPTGKPMAVPECGGLVCDQGFCTVCTEDAQCGPIGSCCMGSCVNGDVSCGAGGGAGGGIGGGPSGGPGGGGGGACSGCYDSAGACVMPSDRQCGIGGQACVSCPAGLRCINGSCGGCGPQSCQGCCLNGQCTSGARDDACGAFGGPCTVCQGGTSCQFGVCLPPLPDAGSGGGSGTSVAVGSPCSGDVDCQPPLTQFCIPAMTGYPGGSCVAVCDRTLPCASGVCITESFAGAAGTICAAACATPGLGRGSCRTGYVCVSAGSASTSPGYCRPRCDNGVLAACAPPQTCNATTGYCQ